MRLGNEHVMGVYVIWKFAKNKEAAQKYLVDQQLSYREHFVRSKFYNFPPWTDAIQGGFKAIRALTAQDAHKPKGKYTVLTTIAEKYTTNPGHPGNSTPVMDEIYNTFLIPQMFAEVAQGKSTPAEAVSAFAGRRRRSTASGGTRSSSRSELESCARAPRFRGALGSSGVRVQLAVRQRSRWTQAGLADAARRPGHRYDVTVAHTDALRLRSGAADLERCHERQLRRPDLLARSHRACRGVRREEAFRVELPDRNDV